VSIYLKRKALLILFFAPFSCLQVSSFSPRKSDLFCSWFIGSWRKVACSSFLNESIFTSFKCPQWILARRDAIAVTFSLSPEDLPSLHNFAGCSLPAFFLIHCYVGKRAVGFWPSSIGCLKTSVFPLFPFSHLSAPVAILTCDPMHRQK